MPPREPRPLKQRQIKTLFLRVPARDWSGVSAGRVREFRASPGNVPQLWNVPLPTLAIAYRKRKATGDYEYRIITLEGVRQEELRAISDEGLLLAGYTGTDARARFRRDWTIREKRRFEPRRKVMVFTVRPVESGDLEATGLALVERLYGEHLARGVDKEPAVISA